MRMLVEERQRADGLATQVVRLQKEVKDAMEMARAEQVKHRSDLKEVFRGLEKQKQRGEDMGAQMRNLPTRTILSESRAAKMQMKMKNVEGMANATTADSGDSAFLVSVPPSLPVPKMKASRAPLIPPPPPGLLIQGPPGLCEGHLCEGRLGRVK